VVVTDNLSSHTSASTRTWLLEHPRLRQVFIPKGACWLNLKRAGGGCSAARRLPGSRSPPLRSSPWPPGSRPASSTPAPGRGCGAGHHHPPATDATPSPTASKERGTRSLRPLLS
jgi:hypothetical protein